MVKESDTDSDYWPPENGQDILNLEKNIIEKIILNKYADNSEEKYKAQDKAQEEAERLRNLAEEHGWTFDDSGEPQVTLQSYSIFDPDQIALVVDQVKPTHEADVMNWGKRIADATECVKRDTQYIRDVASVPANDHTQEMIEVIRAAIKAEEEGQKRSVLSHLFSYLAFWRPREVSQSRDLIVVDSARDRLINAIDRARGLQSAIDRDIEFTIDQIRYCDDKKEDHIRHGDALQVHIDVTGRIYRNLVDAHNDGKITKFGGQDPADIRAEVENNVEKREKELIATRGHLMISYAALESVQAIHGANRDHLVETKNVNETMVIQSLMGLLNIEESISDTMAQMAADQSKAKALQVNINELKAKREKEIAKVSTGLDEVSETLDVFTRTNESMVIGNAEGAKRIMDDAKVKKGSLKLEGPSKETKVLAIPDLRQ